MSAAKQNESGSARPDIFNPGRPLVNGKAVIKLKSY